MPQDHSLKISHNNNVKQIKTIVKNFLDTFIDRDDSVPNTKWRIHEFLNYRIKIAKFQHGGCKRYSVDTKMKAKKCVKNPDLKDNLCFWRCLTIAIYESVDKTIVKKDSKQQRELAKELQNRYFESCEIATDLRTDIVLVRDLPDICRALELNLTVYTLTSLGNNMGGLKALEVYSSNIEKEPQVCLHLDIQKAHFMLLRTMVVMLTH